MALHLLILLPLLGTVVLGVCARVCERGARHIALATTLATVGVFLTTFGSDAFTGGVLQAPVPFGDTASTFYTLAMDGLSAPLVGLTVFLGVIAVLASWRVIDRARAHHALLLGLQAAVTGVFLAQDIVLFYIFWEAVLIPMYFLIGIWGHENRRHAAVKFFIYTFAGSALMLIGILLSVFASGQTAIPAVVDGFQGMLETSAAMGVEPRTSASIVFWLLMAGFLVKIPAFPFHTWLPDAHVEAPTAGSVMLAGVLLKMGVYGMIRIAVPLAPQVFENASGLISGLGIMGIVYGAVMALAQTDLKRLVAYSSVSHMGFASVGVATGTPEGMTAAMLVMVSHGVVSALLFFLVGELYDRTHTRTMDRFSGMGRLAPGWAATFVFGSLASLGLPGLSGFPGELLALVEGFRQSGWWMLVAVAGVVLAGAYNLRAVRGVVQGQAAEEWSAVDDLDRRGLFVALALACPVVILGLWPRLVADIPVRAIELILGGGA